MKHQVPHSLGQAKAKEVAIQALASYQSKYAEYEPQVDWTSDTFAKIYFRIKGLKLNGAIEVLPDTFALDLDVPFVLRPFRGAALSVIEDEIKKWISKAS